MAAGGGILNYINGYHRPFPLTDGAITYPNKPDIVSIPVVIIVALLAPAATIAALNLTAFSLPSYGRSQVNMWRRADVSSHYETHQQLNL